MRGTAADWDVERRFRVTEVALAIIWVFPALSLYLQLNIIRTIVIKW